MNYDSINTPTIINACGTVTRLGGAPIRQAALDAYRSASDYSVSIEQLHASASTRLAELSGAQAGLITSGAAAALTLGTAAILAGYDAGKMDALPHADGFANEMIIAREHRSGYDHAIRAAGARLVEVGLNEQISGAGVRRVETWEYEAAINENTAGIVYVIQNSSRPALAEIITLAKQHDLPIIADAAGELPPHDNFKKLATCGVDLVAFSGGKVIGGPQATGILLGDKDLIASSALQMLDMDDHPQLWDPPASLIDKSKLTGMPRHGLGRGMKVAKEEVLAVLAALEEFLNENPEDLHSNCMDVLRQIESSISDCGIVLSYQDNGPASIPRLLIDVAEAGMDAFDVCRNLRNQSTPIYINHGLLDDGLLMIHPVALRQRDIEPLVAGLRSALVS